jgi:hypothetical protein
MKKGLRWVLERLRGAASGRFREGTAARKGLQQPQRMQKLEPAYARRQH